MTLSQLVSHHWDQTPQQSEAGTCSCRRAGPQLGVCGSLLTLAKFLAFFRVLALRDRVGSSVPYAHWCGMC